MRSLMMAAAFGLLAGCAYPGGGVENPVLRTVSWFSFVEGGDIRAECRPGTPDRYRLVYNGVWQEQVRIYELGEGGDARVLSQRVLVPATLTDWTLNDPLGPWRGPAATLTLDAGQYAALLDAFGRSGMFGGAPVGLELPSEAFHWTAAACRDGAFHFNAWLHPSQRFEGIVFDEALLALERTGVAFNPPRVVTPALVRPDNYVEFRLRVDRDGLFGVAPLASPR